MWTLLFFLPFLLSFLLFGVYAERKISAFMQDRYGPMEVGPVGILQTLADLLKLLQKEDIVPSMADRQLFLSAPILIFLSVFLGYAFLPLNESIKGSNVESGIFFLMAIISLDVLGILLAGWASNNKFSLYGMARSVAQIVSYEVPMGLSILCMVMLCSSLDLHEISMFQGLKGNNFLFGIKYLGINTSEIGGVLNWNLLQGPIPFFVFILFFISALAEAGRVPFDLPESESEIIGGYHTEYSGFRFAIFMLAEYGMMVLLSLLASVLFLGSWNSPFPNISTWRLADWTNGPVWAPFWLVGKTIFLVFLQMWIRWTLPRLRVDQLMTLCWKYLTPYGILLVFLSGLWKLFT